VVDDGGQSDMATDSDRRQQRATENEVRWRSETVEGHRG